MGRDDWYRHEEWSSEIADEFWARLKRSRSDWNKAQSFIQHMADMATDLIPVFAQRSWSLVLVQDPNEDLICSDRPVILVPTGPNPPPFLGYGMTDTEIIMPLNRQMALVGHYGSEGEIFQADRMVVGLFNHRMIHFSHRFVFSARTEIRVSRPTQPGVAF